MAASHSPCLRCGCADGNRARGLCHGCYGALRQRGDGALFDYPRTYRAGVEVVEEYEFFRDFVCPGATVATAAAHLGMTPGALQRALERHRARQRRAGQQTGAAA